MAIVGIVRCLRRAEQFRYELTTFRTIANKDFLRLLPYDDGKQCGQRFPHVSQPVQKKPRGLETPATKGSLTRGQICRHRHHQLIIKSRLSRLKGRTTPDARKTEYLVPRQQPPPARPRAAVQWQSSSA